MKAHLLLVLAFLTITCYSQHKIEVKSSSESFSVGSVEAFSVEIYEADIKQVQKAWKKLLKKNKGKVKMKAEIFADDALFKKMSDNTVDIYSKVLDKEEGVVELHCAVNLGGSYLSKSSHANKYSIFANILREFVVNVSKDAVLEKIKEQEKVLKTFEKDQDNLASDKKKKEKEIEQAKKKIEDNEAAIEQNIKEQELKKKDIEAQKQVVIALQAKEKAIK